MPVYKDSKKTNDGRIYYFVVNYKSLDGKYKKHKSQRYKTKKEAEQAEASYLLEIGKNGDNNTLTFNNIIDQYLKDKKRTLKPQSYKRAKSCCDHITASIGNVSVAKMTRNQYEQFRTYLEESGLSVSYINKLNTQLKTLIAYATNKYDIRNDIPNKYEGFKDNSTELKEMDFFTLDEFKQFISVVDDLRYNAFFKTLFYLGLRQGEANCLNWHKVDWQNNTISITATLSTKMRDKKGNYLETTPKTKASTRTLPMCKHVRESLESLYSEYKKYEGFNENWKCFGGITALPETSIQKAKNRYCKLANVKTIRIHDFRHSCASLLINNGANITLVSRYLGHSDIEMTLNTYSHFYKSKLEELVDVLNKI